jgi:hypothetical protein
MQTANQATFDLFNYGSGDHIQFVVHYTNSTSQSYTFVGTGQHTPAVITAPLGTYIDWIDVYTPDAGSGKLDLESIGLISSTVDSTIPVSLTFTDGDGDPVTGNFTVNVKDGNIPQPTAVVPVVLDLNHNGLVDFASLSAGITFDYLSNGQPLNTAWAGSGDGVLALHTEGGYQVMFGGNGLTDLQGLSATFDTNHDGVLNAQDAQWSSFGAFVAQTDGSGSFETMSQLGITGINLVSDGQSYSAANGDVTVVGETSFTFADGSTGVAADAVFSVAAPTTSANDVSGTPDPILTDTAIMSTLLNMGSGSDDTSAPQNAANLPSVLEAIGDSQSANFMDNLINNLSGANPALQASNDAAHQPASLSGHTDMLLNLLSAPVGGEHGYSGLPFDMGAMAGHEALAAVAA